MEGARRHREAVRGRWRRWLGLSALVAIAATVILATWAQSAHPVVTRQAPLFSLTPDLPQATGQAIFEMRSAADRRLHVNVQTVPAGLVDEEDRTRSGDEDGAQALDVLVDGTVVGQVLVTGGTGQVRLQGPRVPAPAAGTIVELRMAAGTLLPRGTAVLSGRVETMAE